MPRWPRKIYEGKIAALGSNRTLVTVNGQPLPPRRDIERCSNGFEWGYSGAGPQQLAIALAADLFGADKAREMEDIILKLVVAKLTKGQPWAISDLDVQMALFLNRDTANLSKTLFPSDDE